MLRYLLDTNFCIRVLRDRPKGLRERFNDNAEALCVSDIVLYETSIRGGKITKSDAR